MEFPRGSPYNALSNADLDWWPEERSSTLTKAEEKISTWRTVK